MTHERDIEHILDHWFTDGPTQAPHRVFDAVADRIERQPQQPAWRLHLRELHVNTYLKPFLALAAVLVIAFVGYNLLPDNPSGVGGPVATPTPSPTPSPTPVPSPLAISTPIPLRQTDGALKAGTYAFDAPRPAVSFSVPDGWIRGDLTDINFGLALSAFSGDSVDTWYDMRIASKDAQCPESPEPGLGHTASDLVAGFSSRPGIVATAPKPISLGGLDGHWMDLTLAPDWTKTCPFSPDVPSVMLFTDTGTTEGPFWGISEKERMRVIVLEDGAGSNILITIDSVKGSSFDALVAAAMPVIESYKFDVAP